MAKSYVESVDPRIVLTFRALVEAIVPGTPAGPGYDAEQAAGAVELSVHEYMIWSLDHSLSLHSGLSLAVFPLAASTAMLLNAAAAQLIASGQVQLSPSFVPSETPFADLTPADRIRTLSMLERLEVDLEILPSPYRDDGGFIKFMVDYLNHGTMFGDYSEWPAYGSTRLAPPTERRLEYFPVGWRQVGYPGVSKGYRALRGLWPPIQHKGGESSNV